MRHGKPLTRGARVFGTVCLSVLALACLGWIIRDLSEAHDVTDVWWLWTGLTYRAEGGVWVGSGLDFVLLMIYVVSAAVALRSSSAAGILASTGVATVALRLPSVWTFDADQLSGIEDSLRTQTQVTTYGSLALGVALIVTAIAGRRPPETDNYGNQAEQAPLRPQPGPAVVAGLLLGFAGLTLGAWQVYYLTDVSWEAYEEALVGDQGLVSLLDVPAAWSAWTLVLLCLAAAGAALARATFARPLGLVAAGFTLVSSIFYVAAAGKQDLMEHLADLPTEVQLLLLNELVLCVAALAVLFVLGYAPPRFGPTGNQPPYPPYAAGGSGPGAYGGYGGQGGGYGGQGSGYGAPPPPPGW